MNDERIPIERTNPLKDELNDYIELLKQVERATLQLKRRIRQARDDVHETQLLQSDILHIVELSDMDTITPKGAETVVRRLHDMRVERRTAKVLADLVGDDVHQLTAFNDSSVALRHKIEASRRFLPRGFKPRTKHAERLHQDLHHPDGAVDTPNLADIERVNGVTYLVDIDDKPLSDHATVSEAVRAAYEGGYTLRRSPLNEMRLLDAPFFDIPFVEWRNEHLTAFGVDIPVFVEEEDEDEHEYDLTLEEELEDATAEPELAVTSLETGTLDPFVTYDLYRDGVEWVIATTKKQVVARYAHVGDAFTALVDADAHRLKLNHALECQFELYIASLPQTMLSAYNKWLAAVRRHMNDQFQP